MSRPTEFDRLVASQLDLLWHLDPVSATGAGIAEHDHRLGDFDSQSVSEQLAALKSMTGALEEATVDSLDEEVERTALLNDVRVRIEVLERERPQVRDPAWWLLHALNGFHLLLAARDRPPEHRIHALEARLAALPEFLAAAQATMEEHVPILVDAARATIDAAGPLVDAVADEIAADVPESVTLAQGARDALAGFDVFLGRDVEPLPESSFAIGEHAFDFRLQFGHGLRLTSVEVERFGERLVEAVQGELRDLARELSGGEDWRAIVETLRRDRVEEGLIDEYRAAANHALEFVRSRDLMPIPEGPLRVTSTPEFLRPMIPIAAYQPPGAFSSDQTGWFYVTPAPAQEGPATHSWHCRYDLPFVALHETYPGHHLQFLATNAQPRAVRRVVSSPVSVEGWALYCETLMLEQGFDVALEARLFQQLAMLWRAARVVLDARLHARGMSVDDAVDYLVETAHFEPSAARAEVSRYCRLPTYQLCYAVGRREFLRLRDDYLSRRPNASLRDFHASVLGYGGLPVSLMRWGLGLDE